MLIRPCEMKDTASICQIYNYYIENTIVTFEQQPVSIQIMQQRISTGMKNFPWLVCEVDGEVLGYAYASHWKNRAAYEYSVESTIYIMNGRHHSGYGQALYSALLQQLSHDYHAIIAGIALPNEASINFHQSFGFEKIAQFREVGKKFGRWIDVGYWQKINPHTDNH